MFVKLSQTNYCSPYLTTISIPGCDLNLSVRPTMHRGAGESTMRVDPGGLMFSPPSDHRGDFKAALGNDREYSTNSLLMLDR